jgi:alpha-L-fucosidase 2
MKRQLLLYVFFAALALHAAPPSSLWYPKPATKWLEALPIGNGSQGA